MKVIFVNGNIGAGKETIILRMQEVLTNKGYKVKVALEPVQLWRESGMLDKMYKGKYLEFQQFAITSRVNEIYVKHQEALMERCNFLLVETNLLVDLKVYAKTVLTEREYYQYLSYWHAEVNLGFKMANNIFIDVPPEVSMSRILSRGRNEESRIQISYLRKLYYAHLILNEEINPFVLKNDCAVYDNKQLSAYINSIC